MEFDWTFWANWGIAGAFAGILLTFLLRSVAKRLDKIEYRLQVVEVMVTWLYTKADGPPIVDLDGRSSSPQLLTKEANLSKGAKLEDHH